MVKQKIDHLIISNRYKYQKLDTMNEFFSFWLDWVVVFSSSFCLYSLFQFDFFSVHTIQNSFVPIISMIFTVSNNSRITNYTITFVLLWLIHLKCIYFAFWNYPEYSGVAILNSISLLCNAHLDLIYDKTHGYFTIILFYLIT